MRALVPQITLGTPYRLALGCTAGLLAAVCAARYLYVPALGRIAGQRAELSDLKVKVADAEVLAEALPRHEAAVRAAEARYQDVDGRVGAGQSVARVLDGLGRWAKDHRIEVVAVQPGGAQSAEPPLLVAAGPGLVLQEVPLGLRLKGRYRQLGEFLGKLPAAPFLGTVRGLTIRQPASDSAQLEADVTLALYLKHREPGAP